jgi:hypothetical protein
VSERLELDFVPKIKRKAMCRCRMTSSS